VPTAPVSVAVALADKIDLLTGFWAINERPTGSKDPFALRRAALGLIRSLLEKNHRLSFMELVMSAFSGHRINDLHYLKVVYRESDGTFTYPEYWNDEIGASADEDRAVIYAKWAIDWERDTWIDPLAKWDKAVSGGFDYLRISGEQLQKEKIAERAHVFSTSRKTQRDLLAFLHDRLKVHLRDQGIRHDVIDACLPLPGNDDLVLLVARVRALQEFLGTEDGATLLAGYKRATNIVEIEEKKDGVEYSLDPEPGLAQTEAERALFAALDAAEAALGPALEAEDFGAAMTALAGLRAPIDAFFDTTTVNAETSMIRRNRLCLLNRIRAVMDRVAVFSKVEGG
jgi:glycyl-tRNA synthetase beta chain